MQMNLPAKQRGATLIVALIILLVLTILGFSSSQTTLMQEKMTFAAQDGHVALQSVELGISEAEAFIENNITTLSDFANDGRGTVKGLYTENNGPLSIFASDNWDSSDIAYQQASTTVHSDVDAPLFYIVDMGITADSTEDVTMNIKGYGVTTGAGDVNAFRIVSRGTGRSSNTERYVISYYGKRL